MPCDLTLIQEPKIYLLGRQTIDDEKLAEFLGDHDVAAWETDTCVAGEKLVEVAGRSCYMSFAKPRPGGNAAYLEHILSVGHGSVLEHSVYNLLITGVSRSFTHELVRHRAGFGYSQLSQRYVDESECEFVIPPEYLQEVGKAIKFWENNSETTLHWQRSGYDEYLVDFYGADEAICMGLRWLASMERAKQDYQYLADYGTRKLLTGAGPNPTQEQKTEIRKKSRESARSVLPNATETKIFVTANARALRHFLEMRGSRFADAEIRRAALAIHEILLKESPNIFRDFRRVLTDGILELVTSFKKV